MTSNEILSIFLKDEKIAEKYGITAENAETMKVIDETPILFIKVLQECILEYERGNTRAATNLKSFVEANITDGDIVESQKRNLLF